MLQEGAVIGTSDTHPNDCSLQLSTICTILFTFSKWLKLGAIIAAEHYLKLYILRIWAFSILKRQFSSYYFLLEIVETQKDLVCVHMYDVCIIFFPIQTDISIIRKKCQHSTWKISAEQTSIILKWRVDAPIRQLATFYVENQLCVNLSLKR